MASPADQLAARLGLGPGPQPYLERAFVHSSYVNEHRELDLTSNERLEYLGDTVVSLIISEALWRRHPHETEGALTTRRAAIVSTRGLSRIAARVDLGAFLLVGQGAERSGERLRGSVLAAALEAIVAAIYLDHGLDAARQCLLTWAAPELDTPAGVQKPAKSRLQEHAFATTGRPPSYHVLSAEGPDHAKHYVVEVSIGDELLGHGEGNNRRDAESRAALAALSALSSTDRLNGDEAYAADGT